MTEERVRRLDCNTGIIHGDETGKATPEPRAQTVPADNGGDLGARIHLARHVLVKDVVDQLMLIEVNIPSQHHPPYVSRTNIRHPLQNVLEHLEIWDVEHI